MASRSRIDMSLALFLSLVVRAAEDGVVIRDSEKARWITRHSERDAELAAKGDVSALVLSRQLRSAVIRHGGDIYFVMSGFPECEEIPLGLVKIPLTSGLFGVAINELAIRSSASGSAIRDVIEDRYMGVLGYEGHSLDEIEQLFPTILCFSVDPAFEISKSESRLVGSYLSRSYIDGPLEFEDDLRDTLGTLFEAGNKHIPFSLVLQGLLSFSWAGFYIELYRCIEHLYAVPRLIQLASEWKTSSSLRDAAELIERTLGWRPKEDESLVRLLQSGCSLATLNSLCQALKTDVSSDITRAGELAARAIYKTRNSHVHFRPVSSASTLSASEWNSVLSSMLKIIMELYSKFGRTFLTAPAKAI